MRVLLLADRTLAEREHAMMRRLEVGLIDEGMRVVRGTPSGCPAEPGAGLAGALSYNDSRWRLGALSPVRSLSRDLLDLDTLGSTDDRPIDTIHVFGEQAWSLAFELARELGTDLAIEAWSARAKSGVDAMEARAARLEAAGGRAVWLAPDERMKQALSSMRLRWPVNHSCWGVHLADESRVERPQGAPVSFGVLSTGQDAPGMVSLLRGLAFAARAHPDLLAFVDASAVNSRHVWQEARDLNLLDRLSLVPQMESRRDLVLMTDVFVQPEALGEQHTLVLESMAAGRCVIARADPLVEALSAPGPALIVTNSSPAGWEEALNLVLNSPDHAQALGAAGKKYISERRLAHMQVKATIDAYRALRADQPLAFAAGAAGSA